MTISTSLVTTSTNIANIRIKEYYSLEGVTMDFLLRPTGLIDEREEMATAVRIALGTDAMADVNDILPDPDSTDRRGWWGDLDAIEIWDGWTIGTRAWLLQRAKITPTASSEGSTLERARRYVFEAIQPFIDRQVASFASVIATRTNLQTIEVDVTIYRGPLPEIALRYQLLWEEPLVIDALDQSVGTDPHKIRIPYNNLAFSSTAPTVA